MTCAAGPGAWPRTQPGDMSRAWARGSAPSCSRAGPMRWRARGGPAERWRSTFARRRAYHAVMSDLAPMREQVYSDPRPKEHFDRFHARARTREPDWVYELVRVLTSLYAYTFLRARAITTDNVPGAGAVILAPNHFSFMDHFLIGAYIRRKVRFMAKSQLFKRPMQFIYTHGGVFPVRRGARDDDTFITAKAILTRKGAITMYCEGGRS